LNLKALNKFESIFLHPVFKSAQTLGKPILFSFLPTEPAHPGIVSLLRSPKPSPPLPGAPPTVDLQRQVEEEMKCCLLLSFFPHQGVVTSLFPFRNRSHQNPPPPTVELY
jgi:hypothetical protein